jgi:type I site-specific restriction endonuclease
MNRAVADGVNVRYEVFRIRTRVTDQGGKVDAAEYQIPVRDRLSRGGFSTKIHLRAEGYGKPFT